MERKTDKIKFTKEDMAHFQNYMNLNGFMLVDRREWERWQVVKKAVNGK